jgi:hypothetical protein
VFPWLGTRWGHSGDTLGTLWGHNWRKTGEIAGCFPESAHSVLNLGFIKIHPSWESWKKLEKITGLAYSRLAPTLIVSARIAVLKAKAITPWTSVVRRIAGDTVLTSAVCVAQPITNA